MQPVKQFSLNNGAAMPVVGIGCWMGVGVDDGPHVTEMVKKALDVGYRHIDTASNYGNEGSVGQALKESNVPRQEIFLTTKLDQYDHHRVHEALNISLEKLGVDYVDLYLMHWPMAFSQSGETISTDASPTYAETWKQMEQLVATGKAKAIGVSNFSIKTLSTLLQHAEIVPAVNQVEMHPSLPQHELVDFCRARGIALTAYTPLGKHKLADDPIIQQIATAHGVTGAQVLLSWGVQRGASVIPKTVNEQRMRENLDLIELTTAEMRTLDEFHRLPGKHRSMCGFHSEALGGSCFGWTYDELGWHMGVGGVVLE